ncbi:hypothetical protein VAPA_1c21250 [Variovorax paradoxus B4]|uniref:Lysozyme inhibitor LprI N-terminal domain-containing protein n=1 Tax=Variovorax paradoxus B4 TaxID=1246301 RepID=T1XA87_VARPD|nr:hypothetical protein [Variovorax paradoxus]AGU49229.1 hypothetical protein VAPA_1c21250 [Variovorax paradoxus B4]
MQKLHALFAIALLWAAVVPAGAQTSPPHPAEIDPALVEYGAARERIGANLKAALGQCELQVELARAVCIKEAQGRQKVALAELDHQRSPSDANARRLAEARVSASYDVARETCNERQGGDKAACLSRASEEESKARAGIKTGQ